MQIVRVYKNLHNGLWSIMDKKTRRVIGHTRTLLLEDAYPVVLQGGRNRVLREKKKNVHAFIEGRMAVDAIGTIEAERVNVSDPSTMDMIAKRILAMHEDGTWDFNATHSVFLATYNPYRGPHFVQEYFDNPTYQHPWTSLDVVSECLMHAGCEKYRQQILCWP